MFLGVSLSTLVISFSQNISTVAGCTGYTSNGYNSDGVVPTSAQLSNPVAVDVDASGNIYFIDGGNLRLRQITTAGIVITLAGTTNGSSGYSASTGVPPISVSYQTPMYDITLDGSGNKYFVERDRIRKITASTNLVSIVAGTTLSSGASAGDGGLPTAAGVRFNRMSSIAVDGSGNIYIVDRGNHRVRMVSAATGNLSTVAGTGTAGFSGDAGLATAAQLNFPHGVAVDAAGNVYIGDRDNNRIRKITVSTGIITTVAGNGTAGYAGDGAAATAAQINLPTGVAIDASGNIYITDQNNQCIRKVTASTGFISTVAGNQALGAGFSGDGGAATSAQLNFPLGTAGTAGITLNIGVDASGNIYIPDYSNQRLRKVTASTGVIGTIAGTGTQGYLANGGPSTFHQFYYPKDVDLDASGNIYVVQNSGIPDCIWKISPAGYTSIIAGTGTGGASGDGGLATAATISADGVVVNAAGDVYFVSGNYARIRKIDAATGIISTMAGTGVSGYSGDGGLATAAQINVAGSGITTGMAIDASGDIYFADDGNFRIRKITVSTGIITTVAGNGTQGFLGDGGLATSARIGYCYSVAVDGSGNIYIGDEGNNRIRKVTASTGIISTVAGTGTGGYTGDGGLATAAQVQYPRGIACDATGNFYFCQSFDDVVRMVTLSTGVVTTIAGNGTTGFSGDGGPATSAQMNSPSGIAIRTATGCLYIADWSNNRIRAVDMGDGVCITPPATLLPVNLLSLNVSCSNAKALCTWSTASETNNDYFTVERSEDGKIWNEAGTVKGSGNSSMINNYEFMDESPFLSVIENEGKLYYRLKQTDFDGKYEYFGSVSVSCFTDEDWNIVIQNSVSGENLSGTLMAPEDAELILRVIDIQGKVIRSERILAVQGSNYLSIELSDINAGMYLISIQNSTVSLSRKFVKN